MPGDIDNVKTKGLGMVYSLIVIIMISLLNIDTAVSRNMNLFVK